MLSILKMKNEIYMLLQITIEVGMMKTKKQQMKEFLKWLEAVERFNKMFDSTTQKVTTPK